MDVQIVKLEAQVCELGEYNEDLSMQLMKEPIERLEDNESLYLESKLVEPKLEEPTINNAIVD